MSEQQPKTLEELEPNTKDALQSLDQMLEAEDPNFNAEMSDVKSVELDANVVIEAAAIDADTDMIHEDEVKEKFFKKILYRIKIKFILFGRNIKYQCKLFVVGVYEILKEWIPKVAKSILSFLKTNANAFARLSGPQKLMFVFGVILLGTMLFLLKINLTGQWIPKVDKPQLHNFGSVADHEIDLGKDKEFIPLYTAFSLPHFEYLLPKFKVNLKPTAVNHWPMAAMELIITLDTRETAVELKDREAAAFDRVQRVIEGVTYEQMDSPLGKEHLKALIKKEIDKILTQGWVEDVHYKTLVIKP